MSYQFLSYCIYLFGLLLKMSICSEKQLFRLVFVTGRLTFGIRWEGHPTEFTPGPHNKLPSDSCCPQVMRGWGGAAEGLPEAGSP